MTELETPVLSAGNYRRGWRNRGYTFYTQHCYADELDPKLKMLLDKYGLAFDDEWVYFYPKKKKPELRPSAVRRPVWQEFDERFGVTASSKGYLESNGAKTSE